jgi:hypothetical protein
MTLAINHKFVSAKGDGTDATLLRPSNWNDTHNITLATNTLIGRATAGAGAAEEIPCTAAARSVLAAADVAAILAVLGVSPATTGDVKLTLKTAADAGWVMFDDGTIGDASSGSSTRANADCQALFTLLYTAVSDPLVVLFTSSGVSTTKAAQGSAATAWANHCRLALPKTLGRALAIAGAGAGLTARLLSATAGAEAMQLVTAHLPPYTPTGTVSAGSTTFSVTIQSTAAAGGSGPFVTNISGGTGLTTSITPTVTGTPAFTGSPQGGSSAAFGLMQPTSFLNAMVKL